ANEEIPADPVALPASRFCDMPPSVTMLPMCAVLGLLQVTNWPTDLFHVLNETDMPPTLVMDSFLPPDFCLSAKLWTEKVERLK
ncbi:MAG: hypothetical protein Q8K87_16890, partial [Hydrogenophaga sp.]|nr:hypothetical protein [Hydrogenophaga sp.]